MRFKNRDISVMADLNETMPRNNNNHQNNNDNNNNHYLHLKIYLHGNDIYDSKNDNDSKNNNDNNN